MDHHVQVEGSVRVLISGGGTGGHVYPLLAVVEALPTQGDTEVLYVGSVGGMEADIVARWMARGRRQEAGGRSMAAEVPRSAGDHPADKEHPAMNLAYRAVDAAPIRGVTPWKLPGFMYRLWQGYRQSLRLLDEWTADVALVSGAYVSVPVALAARRRQIPVMVYLPDREPGLAVRLLSTFVHSIAVSFEPVRHAFPRAVKHKVWVSGYPVRKALLEVASDLSNLREQGFRAFDLNPALKTLLVMGGSRGARPINRALVAALPALLPECQVVHLTGQLDWPWVDGARAGLSPESRARYRAYPYLHEDLPIAMAVADLVVARAGAATLAEFPAVGLPSLLVPYPYSGGHQEANADFMAEHGASLRLDDAALDSSLEEAVLSLFRDEPALERMRKAARALARPDAALQLARELCRLAGSPGLRRA